MCLLLRHEEYISRIEKGRNLFATSMILQTRKQKKENNNKNKLEERDLVRYF